MTGSRTSVDEAGVHTFKLKQSSLVTIVSGSSSRIGWGHAGPGLSLYKVPSLNVLDEVLVKGGFI
jgi:hypothetical protein